MHPTDTTSPRAGACCDRVDQRVTLAVSGDGSPREGRKAERTVDFTEGNASGKPLPSLGFQFVGSSPHPDMVLELLAALRPKHLRVDLDLVQQGLARRMAPSLKRGRPPQFQAACS